MRRIYRPVIRWSSQPAPQPGMSSICMSRILLGLELYLGATTTTAHNTFTTQVSPVTYLTELTIGILVILAERVPRSLLLSSSEVFVSLDKAVGLSVGNSLFFLCHSFVDASSHYNKYVVSTFFYLAYTRLFSSRSFSIRCWQMRPDS